MKHFSDLHATTESDFKLEIEMTTSCTLACPACVRTTPFRKVNPDWNVGHIDKRVVLDAVRNSNYDQYVFCGAFGDAIYHPDFIEIFTELAALDKKILIETNGAFRSTQWWQAVADIPWKYQHFLRFSIDGMPDTNHIYRVNSKWDSIQNGLNILKERKNELRLIWKYLVFPYNEHQVEEAREFSRTLGFHKFNAVKRRRNYNSNIWKDDEQRRQIEWHNA